MPERVWHRTHWRAVRRLTRENAWPSRWHWDLPGDGKMALCDPLGRRWRMKVNAQGWFLSLE